MTLAKISLYCILKACVRCFLSNFYFSPNDSPSKTPNIQIFVFSFSPLFLLVSHCFRGWSKKNPTVYDVINCLNFVWFLEKEIKCDIETLFIDRVKQGTFLSKNHAENVHEKLVPDPFLILIYNLKQPLCARNSFKIKIFWQRIIKKF